MIIKGRVIDRQTQQGVPGIPIKAVPTGSEMPPDFDPDAITDEQGQFEIQRISGDGPPFSVYTFTALALEGGFGGQGRNDATFDGETYEIVVDVSPQQAMPQTKDGRVAGGQKKKAAAKPMNTPARGEQTPRNPTEKLKKPASPTNEKSPEINPLTLGEKITLLRPHLNGQSLSQLHDIHLDSLAEKSGLQKEDVTAIAQSHAQAKVIPLPVELLHILRKDGREAASDELINKHSVDQLHAILVGAIDTKAVSPQTLTEFEILKPHFANWQAARTPLSKLNSTYSLSLSETVLHKLESKGVRTLHDIRKKGGLSKIEGLDFEAEDEVVKTLNAHADLSRLPVTPHASKKLIEKGYKSLLSIADTPSGKFVTDMQELDGDLYAARLKASADAQSAVTSNLLTAERTGGGAVLKQLDELRHPKKIKCDCQECESILSPLAYLADLLSFTRKWVTYRDEDDPKQYLSVDWQVLQNWFFQPFGQLTGSCNASESQVRQVRLCIEVLRKYIDKEIPIASDPQAMAAGLEQVTKEYTEPAYRTLLSKLGTSFDELRLMKGVVADEQRLADPLCANMSGTRCLSSIRVAGGGRRTHHVC